MKHLPFHMPIEWDINRLPVGDGRADKANACDSTNEACFFDHERFHVQASAMLLAKACSGRFEIHRFALPLANQRSAGT